MFVEDAAAGSRRAVPGIRRVGVPSRHADASTGAVRNPDVHWPVVDGGRREDDDPGLAGLDNGRGNGKPEHDHDTVTAGVEILAMYLDLRSALARSFGPNYIFSTGTTTTVGGITAKQVR